MIPTTWKQVLPSQRELAMPYSSFSFAPQSRTLPSRFVKLSTLDSDGRHTCQRAVAMCTCLRYTLQLEVSRNAVRPTRRLFPAHPATTQSFAQPSISSANSQPGSLHCMKGVSFHFVWYQTRFHSAETPRPHFLSLAGYFLTLKDVATTRQTKVRPTLRSIPKCQKEKDKPKPSQDHDSQQRQQRYNNVVSWRTL